MTDTTTQAVTLGPSNHELFVRSARAKLKLVRKDIVQMYNSSKAALTKEDEVSRFLSMYPCLLEFKRQYMEEFVGTMDYCIKNNVDNLFPTEDDFNSRSEINSACYQIIEIHQKLSAPPVAQTSVNSSLNTSALSTSRLPRISLPKFSGNLTEWPKFKQLFESMIHSSPDIPAIQKFHYLSTSLSGEPLTLISSLIIEEANYPLAWNAICERYDNKRLLAASYVNKVLEYSTPPGVPTLPSLQNFIATVAESIASLKSINIDDEADFIWLTLALRKLDHETRKQFETYSVQTEWPTFNQLKDFVQGRIKIMQLSESSSSEQTKSFKPSKSSSKSLVLATTHPVKSVCSCKPPHQLYECSKFREKSINGKRAFLKGKLVCFNCLKPGHVLSHCPSSSRCRACSKKHHTLLHFEKPSPGPISTDQVNPGSPQELNNPLAHQEHSPGVNDHSIIASVTGPSQVLLGTAVASIIDRDGQLQPLRILVDCGSQFSLVTAECARRLGLNWGPSRHKPVGAGETPLPRVKGQLRCTIKSRIYPEHSLVAEPLVVTTITGYLPSSRLKPVSLSDVNNQDLADSHFWEPQSIDFLLGGDLFMRILLGPPRTIDENYQALPTTLGLIVMGSVNLESSTNSQLHCHCLTESPCSDEVISRFWETEDVNPPLGLNSSLDPCEEHFLRTHYREASGRYVVALPFKEEPVNLESSKFSAAQQLKSLELKLSRNPSFSQKYNDFLREYLELGHMSPTSQPSSYVIPHHGVFKAKDPDSKIRVVFNASARTPYGSLNDKLHTGPKLQKDLSLIILNFRRHFIAVTADIIKMYRQILIRPEDRKYQHILWRPDPKGQIASFELNTVTYGVKSAPYQALRTIKQLVVDEGKPYPVASQVLSEDIYVDDIVSGANSLEDALKLKDELTLLLGKGKFEIHKWTSNSQEFLEDTEPKTRNLLELTPKESCSTQILGMFWNPVKDIFFFRVNSFNPSNTKRAILSVIARLFDPMGFLSPVIFKAKTILQAVWKSDVGWDDTPEPKLVEEWSVFVRELQAVNNIIIDRYVLSPSAVSMQLVGFCDASLKGFAAAIYLRVVTSGDQVQLCLLKAKTKLAPQKPSLTVPRLELSAAHLLVKLFLSVQPFLSSINVCRTLFFTDSTIVLGWINKSPHLFQTFVSNRISYIISYTKPVDWFHINSQENPADVASRGTNPAALKDHALWWAGPTMMLSSDWQPEQPIICEADLPEIRCGLSLVVKTSLPDLLELISRYSNYQKLLRVVAYVLRVASFIKLRKWAVGTVTAAELDTALMTCVKITQRYDFREEFSWDENRPNSKRLLILDAYADEEGVLRVGGRLMNSNLPEDSKFPIILSGNCHLTSLLINHFHHTFFHLSHQALLALLRRRFWIFRLRQRIKSELSRCLSCFKARARPENPLMGQFPVSRVTPTRPFTHCGVDYAGPFMIKTSSYRNASIEKAYLCIFVCMATRAVHLELVSSLTTECFLATLDRFIARRGRPHSIFSDNATNFVGAARRLRDLFAWLKKKETQEAIEARAANEGFRWSFIPPYSPHFGGIWEAAVRSAKAHLYRTVGERPFRFEELATLFARIESILNSRPICSTSDSSDGDILTPGHFLIGAPLVAMPERDLTNLKMSHLSRWQLVSSTIQHFWKRWHAEYLQGLQKRPKWYHRVRALQVGDLVLIADPSSSPLQWNKARIMQCFPGNDGITRVVSVRDQRGIKKVPVHNLVSLSHITHSPSL